MTGNKLVDTLLLLSFEVVVLLMVLTGLRLAIRQSRKKVVVQ